MWAEAGGSGSRTRSRSRSVSRGASRSVRMSGRTQVEAAEISTWKVLLVLLAGAAFAAVVIFGDSFSWSESHREFARDSGPFTLSVALMCAQTGLWALALAWLVPSVRRLTAL